MSERSVHPSVPTWRTHAVDALWMVPALALVLWVGAGSLDWRMLSDTPMMMYQAFLMDHYGWVPYRDFFDMNMLGSYAAYVLIGKVFGYSDVALRVADLSLLAGLGLITAALGRRLGSLKVGVAAALMFALWFLRGGGLLQLQREFLAMIPIAMGTWFAWSHLALRRRAVLTGLSFGMAATIKPDLALGAFPLAALLMIEADEQGHAEQNRVLALGACGVLTPLLLMLGTLAAMGALGPFLAGLPYLKLYGGFGGNHVVFDAGHEQWMYKARSLLELGEHGMLFGSSLLAVALVALSARTDVVWRRHVSLAGLTVCYAVYPVFGGHFWIYHWVPLVWVGSLGLAAGLALGLEGRTATLGAIVRVALLAWLLPTSHALNGFQGFLKHADNVPHRGRADRIALYLQEHLQPGDRVQPLDWVSCGVAHGLLMAKAEAATRFLYSFHFYHHIQSPYIQELRSEFLTELREARPRFIVQGRHGRPYFSGVNSSDRFHGLLRLLNEGYTQRVEERWYTLWELREPPHAMVQP